jgi:hypothetical protein
LAATRHNDNTKHGAPAKAFAADLTIPHLTSFFQGCLGGQYGEKLSVFALSWHQQD